MGDWDADTLWNAVAAWVRYYGSELNKAVLERLTVANGFKVLLLLVILYMTLRIIGRVNGIKGTGTWKVNVKTVGGLGDKLRLTRGTIGTDKETIEEYDGRSGTIEFRDPAPPRKWWQKRFGLGKQKLILSKDCNFEVRRVGNLDPGVLYVGDTIYENLLAYVRANARGDQSVATLDTITNQSLI